MFRMSDVSRRLFRRCTKKAATPPINRARLTLTSLEDRTTPTPVVTIAAMAGSVTEGGSTSFQVTRSETAGTLIVNFSLAGTATFGTDYNSNSSPIMFPPGVATANISVQATNDSTSEPTETVIATITSGSGYTVGTPSSATVNIYDNDLQTVSVTSVADAILDGTSGVFRFTRTGDLSGPLTVAYTVDGTAVAGTDYAALSGTATFAATAATADVIVTALPNGASGPTAVVNSVTVTVVPPPGATYMADGVTAALWVVSYAPAGVNVQELPSQSDEGTVERLRVTRSGDISQPVTVTFMIDPNGSTAIAGVDYDLKGDGITFAPDSLSGTITFAAGSAVADIYVVPATQAVAPVLFTLQSGVGYVVGAGATVPVNLNMAQPYSTIDFSGIRTDINYKIDVTVHRPQVGGRVLVDYKLGTVTVNIGDSVADIRDKIYELLNDAGYEVAVAPGGKLRVYSTNAFPVDTLKLTFKDPTNAAGQVPPDGVKPPTLIYYGGVRVEYNGKRLFEPKPK